MLAFQRTGSLYASYHAIGLQTYGVRLTSWLGFAGGRATALVKFLPVGTKCITLRLHALAMPKMLAVNPAILLLCLSRPVAVIVTKPVLELLVLCPTTSSAPRALLIGVDGTVNTTKLLSIRRSA